MLWLGSVTEEFVNSNFTEPVVTCIFMLLLVDRLVIDNMIDDFASRIGEAKSECVTAVGLRVC